MNGAGEILRHILLQERDGRPRRDVHRPRIGLDYSGDQPHQRRLPGAVAAEQADPLPGLDVAGHVIEQRRTTKAKRKVAKRDKRHEATQGNETRGRGAVSAAAAPMPRPATPHTIGPEKHRPKYIGRHFPVVVFSALGYHLLGVPRRRLGRKEPGGDLTVVVTAGIPRAKGGGLVTQDCTGGLRR